MTFLCYVAIVLLFVSSWGSIIALCLGQSQLAFYGLLLFIGVLALAYLVSVISWSIEEIKAHTEASTKRHLEIMSAANERNRAVMEMNFSTKEWYIPFAYAAIVTFYIMMFGVFGSIYLISWLFSQLREHLHHHYAKAT